MESSPRGQWLCAMGAAGARGVRVVSFSGLLAWSVLVSLVSALIIPQPTKAASQKFQSPTFQWKDAKTPAESADAIKLLERALELTQTALGPDDSVVGDLAYRLAQRYDDAADYENALRLFEQSLAIREKAFGPEHPAVGDCLNDMAVVYDELQDYDKALELYQRSLAIAEKLYGTEHPEVATTLASMADSYRSKGKYAEALNVAERSLRIRRKALGPEHPDIADSLSTLAEIYRDSGDLTKASEFAEQALAIAEKSLRPDHPLIAEYLMTLAGVNRDLSELGKATLLQRRALVINERVSGPEHPDVFRSLACLAELYGLNGDRERSISTFSDLSNRQRRYLARSFQSASWVVASGIANALRSSAEILESFCDAEVAKMTNSVIANAAENSALNKAFWEEVQAARAAFEASRETKAADLHSRYQLLQAQLAKLPETEVDQRKRDATRLELESNLNQVNDELGDRIGAVAQNILKQDLTLAAIADQLPSGSVLIDFVEYRRYDFAAKTNQWKEQRCAAYLTFPIQPNSTNLSVERIDLGEVAPIDEAIGIIARRLSAIPPQYRAADIRGALQRLSTLVYAQIAGHLTNVSHILICPDGQLARIPFEMLPLPPFGEKPRYLIQEKTVTYATSGREIARLAQPSKPRRTNNPVVLGNPDFALDLSDTTAVTNKTDLLASSPSATKTISRSYKGFAFESLPGSEDEAKNVAKLLGKDCVLLLGKNAREAELKKVVSPRILHVATHGFFLTDQEFKRTNQIDGVFATSSFVSSGSSHHFKMQEDDPENPMIRCGIALAGANHANSITNSAAEDGLLTGLEASQLNLQATELVILSACQTGVGDVKIGEGVMSLRRAFRIAGAETVLASHWPIDDKATTQLMTEFIRRWKSGEPRGIAWREAQLTLLHSKDFSNPYFWAAFTLTGQWR